MPENTSKERLTNAEVLGKYDKELAEQGFDADIRRDLVLKAADHLQDYGGLGVKA